MSVLPISLAPPEPRRAPRWRRRLARGAWPACLALLLLLPAARALLRADYDRFLRAARARDDAEQRLCDRIDAVRGRPAGEVLERLGVGARAYRLRGTLQNYALAFKFIDRATGQEFRLYFKDDRLTTWAYAPTPFTWRRGGSWDGLERARWVAVAVFLFLWSVTLLAALGAWRLHRRPGTLLVVLASLILLYAWPGDRRGSEAPWLRFLPPRVCCLRLLEASLIVRLLPVRLRLRRRSGPPRCKRCRYDLTGNESGVCPECGGVVSNLAYRAGAEKLAEIVDGAAPGADEDVSDDEGAQPDWFLPGADAPAATVVAGSRGAAGAGS